jgi:hypothetical protein
LQKKLIVKLHESLKFVIEVVNRIRSKALNTKLFKQLCEVNDEEFNKLLLHTEVRWLSKDQCLTRFFNLFDTIVEFLDTKDKVLTDNLIKSKSDIAYLTDLFATLNIVSTSCSL